MIVSWKGSGAHWPFSLYPSICLSEPDRKPIRLGDFSQVYTRRMDPLPGHAHRLGLAAIVACAILYVIHLTKPRAFYTSSGTHRQFGFAQRGKTILPLWFAAILIAATSYSVIVR